MRSFIAHCHMQSRRLCFCGVLAFLSGMLLYGHLGGALYGVPVPVAVGILYCVSVMIAALLTTFFLPNVRRLVDAVAVTRLSLALIAAAMPGLGRALSEAPEISGTIVIGSAALLVAAGPRVCRYCRTSTVPEPVHSIVNAAVMWVHWLDRTNTGSPEADAPAVAS